VAATRSLQRRFSLTHATSLSENVPVDLPGETDPQHVSVMLVRDSVATAASSDIDPGDEGGETDEEAHGHHVLAGDSGNGAVPSDR